MEFINLDTDTDDTSDTESVAELGNESTISTTSDEDYGDSAKYKCRTLSFKCIPSLQQHKTEFKNWPRHTKLTRLAAYSACQECKRTNQNFLPICDGWKSPSDLPGSQGQVALLAALRQPCTNCHHVISMHIEHVMVLPEEELDLLVKAMLDMEQIYMNYTDETDSRINRVYEYLYERFKAYFLDWTELPSSNVLVTDALGVPPFDEHNIDEYIVDFMERHQFRFPFLDEYHANSLAGTVLDYLNDHILQIPTIMSEPTDVYSKNFNRWMIYCFVPKYCTSMESFQMTNVFGRAMLEDVISYASSRVMGWLLAHEYRIVPELRDFLFINVPKFLELLEEHLARKTDDQQNPTVADPQNMEVEVDNTHAAEQNVLQPPGPETAHMVRLFSPLPGPSRLEPVPQPQSGLSLQWEPDEDGLSGIVKWVRAKDDYKLIEEFLDSLD